MVIVWRWGKAKVNRLLGNADPPVCVTHGYTFPLPYEILEMIVAHFPHDLPTLKACSLTCRSWYTVVVPRIHHTLTLGRATGGRLKALSGLHKSGLLPLVKEIRMGRGDYDPWLSSPAFGYRDLRRFSAFTNVHTLRVRRLEIYSFVQHIEHYFEHLSPTLRSIALPEPQCTPRQLAHFLAYFSNLDNIEIWRMLIDVPDMADPGTKHPLFSAPKLRGQLMICEFPWVETWTQLIASCGGLRFRHMYLCGPAGCTQFLLGVCANTLETLRFNATDVEVVGK